MRRKDHLVDMSQPSAPPEDVPAHPDMSTHSKRHQAYVRARDELQRLRRQGRRAKRKPKQW